MPQGTTKGPEVYCWTLLPATFGPCCYRVLPPRENDTPPSFRVQRVSVVWQRQEGVTPPPLHGVPVPATPDPEALEAGGKGLRVGKGCGWKHPRAPAVRKLWKEKTTEAVLEFLEDTPAGRWISAGVARAPREEVVGEGAVSGGEEGGPGPL